MTYVSRQPIQSPHRPNTGLEIGRNGLIRADSGFDGRIGRVPFHCSTVPPFHVVTPLHCVTYACSGTVERWNGNKWEQTGANGRKREFIGEDWSLLEQIGVLWSGLEFFGADWN